MAAMLLFVLLCVDCVLAQLTASQQSSIFNAVVWPAMTGNPTDVGEFFIRTVLQFDGHTLTGVLPETIGQLQLVEEVWLSDHQLTGPIPVALGLLPNLRVVYLDGCRFTGQVPDSLASARNLQVLWINNNQLTGALPAGLGAQPALKELVLFGNQLIGPLPPAIHGGLNRCQLYQSTGRTKKGNCFTCPLPDALPSGCRYGFAGYYVDNVCSDPNCGGSGTAAPSPVAVGLPTPAPVVQQSPAPPPPTPPPPTPAPQPALGPTPKTSRPPTAPVGAGLDATSIGLIAGGAAVVGLVTWVVCLLFVNRLYRARKRADKHGRTAVSSRRLTNSRRPSSARRRGSTRRRPVAVDPGSRGGGDSGSGRSVRASQDIPLKANYAAVDIAGLTVPAGTSSTAGSGVRPPPVARPSDYDVAGMLKGMESAGTEANYSDVPASAQVARGKQPRASGVVAGDGRRRDSEYDSLVNVLSLPNYGDGGGGRQQPEYDQVQPNEYESVHPLPPATILYSGLGSDPQ